MRYQKTPKTNGKSRKNEEKPGKNMTNKGRKYRKGMVLPMKIVVFLFLFFLYFKEVGSYNYNQTMVLWFAKFKGLIPYYVNVN